MLKGHVRFGPSTFACSLLDRNDRIERDPETTASLLPGRSKKDHRLGPGASGYAISLQKRQIRLGRAYDQQIMPPIQLVNPPQFACSGRLASFIGKASLHPMVKSAQVAQVAYFLTVLNVDFNLGQIHISLPARRTHRGPLSAQACGLAP